jgi:hypothetical protein
MSMKRFDCSGSSLVDGSDFGFIEGSISWAEDKDAPGEQGARS